MDRTSEGSQAIMFLIKCQIMSVQVQMRDAQESTEDIHLLQERLVVIAREIHQKKFVCEASSITRMRDPSTFFLDRVSVIGNLPEEP